MEQKITRGDLYWVKMPAPIGNHACVIVSNEHLNAHSNSLEVVLLTTTLKEKSYPTDADIQSSGRPARALCSQIRSVDREQLIGYIGHCTDEEMDNIDNALRESLGLSRQASMTVQCGRKPSPAFRRTEEGLVVEVADDGVYVYAPIQSHEFVKRGNYGS